MRAKTGKNCIHWRGPDWSPSCALPERVDCNLPCEDFLSRSAVKRLGCEELAEEEKRLKQSIQSLQQQLFDLTSERGKILATLTHEFAEFGEEVRNVFIWLWARQRKEAEELTKMAFEFRRKPKIISIPCTNGEELKFAECIRVEEGGLFLFSDGRFFTTVARGPIFAHSFTGLAPSFDYVLLGENRPFTAEAFNQLKELAPIPARFLRIIKHPRYHETPLDAVRTELQMMIHNAIQERFKDFKTFNELENEALDITLKQLVIEYEAMKGLGADG